MADAKTKIATDVLEKLIAAQPDEMRLIGGEMTMQEIRTAKAFLELAKTRITNLSTAPQPAASDVPHDVVRAEPAAWLVEDRTGNRFLTADKERMAFHAERNRAVQPLYATPAPSTSTEEALRAENARLREAIRENFCPRPCDHRPERFGVGQCVDAGECGCMNDAALSR